MCTLSLYYSDDAPLSSLRSCLPLIIYVECIIRNYFYRYYWYYYYILPLLAATVIIVNYMAHLRNIFLV